MASWMLLVGGLLLLQASWIVAQPNCPVVDSISPPSGTVNTMYLVRGSNLDRVSQITVDTGTVMTIDAADTMRNGTHLQFVIGGLLLNDGGARPITFNTTFAACNNQTLQLDLRGGN